MSAPTLICRCWRWRDARIPPALRRFSLRPPAWRCPGARRPWTAARNRRRRCCGGWLRSCRFRAAPTGGSRPLTADLGHVFAVAADHLAAFLSGPARLLRIEFVRRAFLMGRLPALAGDFTLLRFAHGGKTAFGRRLLHAG